MADIILIGERINSTNKRVRRILETRDEGELLQMARDQVEGGASFIDINASMLMKDEKPALGWAAGCVAASVDAGVSLDSPSIDLLLGVLPEIDGEVILNSFTCDERPLERVIAAVDEYGASVIIMLKSREGIPESIDGRMRLAGRVAAAVRAAGVSPSRIYIDPIFSPIATSPSGMQVVLGTIAALAAEYPGFHRIGGLSNVSYGLPRRKLINRTFLAMALSHGLDAVICDTTDAALAEAVMVSETLLGLDPGCRRFLQSYRQKKPR